ncbi:MAG: hypothetical protein PQJ49_02325 [Sphaerochaetaceae bacterium]|nr:hypothetical protein [Sphaerochaetaceae bacterium]MDC7236576.1 hypothetical protein [Sphaerochaetaceae bacterium]MDC7244037.1 hypothetical protein [Sphaerochaetaceae bacterium]MDC7248736.1 hypothetical protein [Sphaerochaetaceae bacterium]
MLESRRVLELGNRLHWYILWLSLGIFIYYNLGLFYDVNRNYMMFVSNVLSVVLLFSLVFGIWILVFSLSLAFGDKIFPTRIFILNILRIILVIILDVTYSFIVNIAGETIII